MKVSGPSRVKESTELPAEGFFRIDKGKDFGWPYIDETKEGRVWRVWYMGVGN